ncbi:uncharacterized protein LOC124697287 [Lolium rigidum]|uniref:uncharacterized protein LOC124697287 n=1 Tax=Lolium rigidum TaxID=89674 RepID=UPI001F5DA8B9|nr:uncharacterized protein LOC124697287 [Lolium rigidum]
MIQSLPGMSSSEDQDRAKSRSKNGAAPGKSSSARAAAPSKSTSASTAAARAKFSSASLPVGGKSRWSDVGVAPFQDGQYVRLLNRGRGGYLFADETGRGVSVDRRREMANTAWVAQVLETDTNYHVLLRSAYGRHLAVTRAPAPEGHVGCGAAQCAFDGPDDAHVMWWTTPGKGGSVVLLHGTSANLRALRANGRYRRWHRGVTVEAINRSRVTSMMEWEVEVIPLRVERPPYQLRPGGADALWHPGSAEKMEVNCAVADDNGSTDGRGWETIQFRGRSLMELGNELAQRLGDGVSFQDITLFIQAGNLGQPTLLLTDLPHRDDRVDIVVFRVGTAGHDRLLFPDLDAE